MRRALAAANWKMHGSIEAISQYCSALEVGSGPVDVAIFVPAVFLNATAGILPEGAVAGIQDIGVAETGAHTGEIAAEMAREMGAVWSIVGHSERRQDQQESDELIGQKAAAAFRGGLRPIVCVGETLEERRRGDETAVVGRQLEAVLAAVSAGDLAGGAIGYEPVWAIGTGETATPEQAQAMHAFIRSLLAEKDAEAAQQTPIVYGGSVKPENAVELFGQADIDGGLVGGASLDAGQFSAIIAAAADSA